MSSQEICDSIADEAPEGSYPSALPSGMLGLDITALVGPGEWAARKPDGTIIVNGNSYDS